MRTRFIKFIKSSFSRLITALKRINRWVIISISIAVTVIVLGFLVYRQWDIIASYKWQFRPVPILLSFLIFSLTLFLMALMWGWIINNLGTKLSYQKHIRYFIISNLAKRIPGTIWYVASRYQFYSADGLDLKITAVASTIEMVLITLAGILVVLVFSTNTLIRYHISPIILIFIFILGLILTHPKVIQWILRKRNVEAVLLNYRSIIQGIIAYASSWILGGLILFEVGNIIYPISSGNIPYFIASWTLVGVISTFLLFSPSNLGITEIGLSLLLSNVVPSSIAVLIAISSRILLIIYEFIWVCIILLTNPAKKALITRKD